MITDELFLNDRDSRRTMPFDPAKGMDFYEQRIKVSRRETEDSKTICRKSEVSPRNLFMYSALPLEITFFAKKIDKMCSNAPETRLSNFGPTRIRTIDLVAVEWCAVFVFIVCIMLLL